MQDMAPSPGFREGIWSPRANSAKSARIGTGRIDLMEEFKFRPDFVGLPNSGKCQRLQIIGAPLTQIPEHPNQ